jgi:hypothetical protein
MSLCDNSTTAILTTNLMKISVRAIVRHNRKLSQLFGIRHHNYSQLELHSIEVNLLVVESVRSNYIER